MNQHHNHVFKFGPFQLDPAERQLTRDGKTVTIDTGKKKEQELSGKPFNVLLVLVKCEGEIVTKHDLEIEVWEGSIVTPYSITQSIKTIRKFLGDDPKNPLYIKTLPRDGYRFIEKVTVAPRKRLRMGTKMEREKEKEAEELYTSGLGLLYTFATEEDLRRAISCFKQSYAIHPHGYPAALAAEAEAHIWGALFSWLEPKEALPTARRLADLALNSDSKLGDARAIRALAELLMRRNWPQASSVLKGVLKQNPTSQPALRGYALWLMVNGRFDEALRKIKRARAVHSTSVLNIGIECMVLYVSGVNLGNLNQQSSSFVYEFMRHVTAELSEYKVDAAWYILGLFYERSGRIQRAISALGKVELTDKKFLGHLVLAYFYAVGARPNKARELLDKLKALGRWVSPFHIGLIELALGNHESAKQCIRDAISQSDPWACLLIDPRLKPLRDDPEFLNMFRLVNLSPSLLRKIELEEDDDDDEDEDESDLD
jgi:DNA-binding winged helix-turn-helix (wHTH) protein